MNKKTWKLDHYYYGKHIEGDKAIGGFTVLKRSPGIDDARLTYCEANCHFGGTERVGSDFEQLGLAYGFFPYPEKSEYIVAHARPSRYKNRGHHYLEYHFVFLPEAALEAVSFDPTVFFEAASFEETPSDKPLAVTLDASKGLSSAKIATMFDDILTSFPDASLLPGLLNTMLAGRRVSFQHTPIDGGWRVRFMTGLLQYLPVPVRPSISFVTEVFTDSCTAQVLFEYNHRYASSAGDVRVDWETQTISGTDGLPSYDYTQHLLQKKAHRLPDKANTYLQQPAWKEDLKPLLSGQTNHTAGEILDVALFLHHLKTQQAQNTVNLSTLIRVVQMTDNLLPDERYADLISTLLEEAIKKKQPQKAMESIPAHAIQTSQERLQNTLRMLCSTGHGETCFQVAHHLDKQIAANRFASATAIAWIEHLLASAQESSALRALTTIEKVIRDAAIWKTILQSLQSTISNRPPAFARELLILAAHYQLDDILLSLLKQPVPATYWSPEIQPYQRLVNGKNPAAPETVYPAAQRFRQPEKALALLFRLAARQQPAALTARDWQQLRSQPEAIRQVLDLYSPEEWASTYTGNLNTLFEVYQRAVQIQRHDTGKQIIVHATRHLEKQVLITYLQNNLQYLTADIADMIFDELADDEARVQLAGLVLANNNWQDATYLTKYAKLAVTLSYHQSDYDRQLIEHLHRLDDALQKQTVMRLVDAHPADTDMIGGVLKKLLVMRTPDDALLTEVIEHLRRIKHLQTALISLDAIFRLNSDTQTILYFFTGRSPVRPADWVSFYEEKLHVLFERLYLLLTQQKFPAADALTDEMLRQLPNTSVLHVFKEEMSKFTHETSLRLAGQIEPKITEPPLQYEILVILLNLGGWNESRYLQSLARLSADSKMSRKQHEMQLIEQLTLLGDQAIPTLKRYTKHYIVNSGNLNQTALGPLETALQKASLQQQITWLQTFFDCFSTNKSSVLQAVKLLVDTDNPNALPQKLQRLEALEGVDVHYENWPGLLLDRYIHLIALAQASGSHLSLVGSSAVGFLQDKNYVCPESCLQPLLSHLDHIESPHKSWFVDANLNHHVFKKKNYEKLNEFAGWMTNTGYRTVLKKNLLQYVKNWNIQQLETLIDDFKPLENLEPELKALYALFNIRRVTGNQELGEFIREAERVADFLTRLSGAFAPDSTDGGNQLDWDVLEAEMQRHINRLAPGEQTRFNRSCETIADQIILLQEPTSFLKQVGRMWPLRGKNKETPPDAVTALKRLAAITGKPTTRPEEE